MADLMKIGDLAQQTGLSIRTLHYYDAIGLLSPSHRTEVGHRRYDAQDISRLQQIVSLRQLGFSLKEIQDCLENPEFSLPQVIDLHRARLQEQMVLSRQLLNQLNAIARELERTQSVAIETLTQTMETITMTRKYFTPEQQEVLENRFQKGAAEWQDIWTQVQAEMNKGTDFNSPSVRKLARRWLWSMKSLIQGDEDIYQSLTQMYQEGAPAASWETLNPEMFEYILKAVSFLFLADFTDLRIPTAKIFTPKTQEVLRCGEIAVRQINLFILGTEGILLGILAEGTTMTAQILQEAGVHFDRVQPYVIKWLGDRPIPNEEAIPSQLPYAPRVKYVIELALELAEQSGHTLLSPEHLFLGILKEAKEGGGLATYILEEDLGVNLVNLEQQLKNKLDSLKHP